MIQLDKYNDKSTEINSSGTNTTSLGKPSTQLAEGRVTRPKTDKPIEGFKPSVCQGHQSICFTKEMGTIS